MTTPDPTAAFDAEQRAACLENWPEAWACGYDPRCCRFPKSCSIPDAPTAKTPDPTAPTPDAALVERLREAVCECGHRAFDHDTGGCKFRAIYHCRPGEDPCPCGKSTTEALAPTVAAIRDAAVAEAVGRELSGFTAWVSRARAYNGSPFAHGQSLYNECLNGVLSNWAGEYLSEAAGADLSADEPLPRVPGPSDPRKAAQ